jgi:hypothetical protein
MSRFPLVSLCFCLVWNTSLCCHAADRAPVGLPVASLFVSDANGRGMDALTQPSSINDHFPTFPMETGSSLHTGTPN